MDLMTYALCKGNGGGGLPSVTSDDNGKVLAVKDGAWEADSNLFIVTVTNTTADKSKTEIIDALNVGKVIIAKKGGGIYSFNYYDTTNAYFTKISNSGGVNILRISDSKLAAESYKKMAPDFGVSDKGKILKIKDDSGSAIVSWEPTKFVVTLTPTAQNFSGTMDKTGAEITAAYEAGQQIVFNVVGFPGFDNVYIPATWYTYATNKTICAACATLVDITSNLQIVIITTDSSDDSYYSTELYPLTPVS